jgi:hypothetical protein
MQLFVATVAAALSMHPASYGQLLADVARENREKQSAEDGTTPKPKVITNKDLPKDPNENPAPVSSPAAEPATAGKTAAPTTTGKDGNPFSARPSSAQPSAERHVAEQHQADQRLADHRLEQQRLAQQRAAEQWKNQILAQKNKMAALQARIEQLKAAMHPANSTTEYEPYPYNRAQAQQLQRVAQVQQQLEEQKRKLEQMQEAARHAGMHTAVYDP